MTPIKQFALPSGRGTWGIGVERGELALVELVGTEWVFLASFPIPRARIEEFLRETVVPKLNELLTKRIAADRTQDVIARIPTAIELTPAGFDYRRP